MELLTELSHHTFVSFKFKNILFGKRHLNFWNFSASQLTFAKCFNIRSNSSTVLCALLPSLVSRIGWIVSFLGRIVLFSSRIDCSDCQIACSNFRIDCTLCRLYCLCLLIVYNVLLFGYFDKMRLRNFSRILVDQSRASGTTRGRVCGLLSIPRQGFNRLVQSSIKCINGYRN